MEGLKIVNVVSNTDAKIEYIIHAADIHIGSSNVAINYDRSAEYRRVFDELRRLIDTPMIKGKCMVVIAGDIFHNKNRVSASCIELFNYLMELLADTPVLIIPGNHDVVMNNHGYSCLIAPLLERKGAVNATANHLIWPNVYYSKNTELIHMCGQTFLHISVYDPRDRSGIEKLTAGVYGIHPTYTLLYHGVVDGIKFGSHVENDTRVSRMALANCHRAILGDIHDHLVFGANRNIVYCGSMIQQNRGEGRDKGVVIWNIAANNYLFKRLANPCGFLTIDIRNLGDPIGERYRERLTEMLNTMKAARDPDFGQTYAVTVITDTYGKDGLFMPEITSIVGREVNAVKRVVSNISASIGATGAAILPTDDTTLDVNVPPHGADIKAGDKIEPNNQTHETPQLVDKFVDQIKGNLDKDNHRVILEDLLLARPGVESAKGKLTREMFEYVWDIHAASEIIHKRVRWTIYKLRFSNLFKYGDNNVIDFKTMRGVCGVVANNRMGKSSILDVIVLALYNKTLRANRGDAINSHSNSAFITIKFVVNGVMWRLKKEFDRHKQTVKLHKREMAPKSATDPTLTPTWVDNTCVDANATYEKVRNEIGDLREFLSTCMQVQESYTDDIIRMKNTDRKRVLSGLLGLDQLKGVAEKARSRLTELTKEVNDITAAMPAEVDAAQIDALRNEVSDIAAKIASHRADIDDTMRKNKEASIKLANYTQIKELRAKILTLETELGKKQAELSKLTTNKIALVANCARYGLELSDNLAAYQVDIANVPMAVINQIDAAAGQFATFANTANMSLVELARRCRGLVASKITTLPATLPTREHSVVEAELADLVRQRKLVNQYDNMTNVELTDAIARYNAEINKLTVANRDLAGRKKQPRDELGIQDRINAIASVYSWNDGCDDCKRNRGEYHKRVNMTALTAELERNVAENAQIARDNAAIDATIVQNTSRISQLMADSTATSAQLGIRARISERMQELGVVREFGGLSETQATSVWRARGALERIEDGYNRMNYYLTTRSNSLKLEVTQCLNYINMYRDDLMRMDKLDDANTEYAEIAKYVESLTERGTTLQRELIDLMYLVETKQKLIAASEANIIVRRELVERLTPLNERIVAINEYIKSLDVKTGLPCRLMQESIGALTGRVNDLLREVSDFSVQTRVDDDKIDFYIRERTTNTSKSDSIKKHGLSVELASGYQKFVITLAYRLSLAATLPCAADFVFIDEGFGCLDAANAAKIGELLHAVVPNYRFMFIISHIDVLHLCLTTPITIRTTGAMNDRSSIVYGDNAETIDEDYIIGENVPVIIPMAVDNVVVPNVVANVVAPNVAAPIAAIVGAGILGAVEPNAGAKVRCECGRMVNRSNLQRHRVTPTHIAQLAARNAVQN